MQARQLYRRFCMQHYGGQLCTTIPRHIVRNAMHVKELVDNHEEMSCRYILKSPYSHLRNGRLILLGQFSPGKENRCALYHHHDGISN